MAETIIVQRRGEMIVGSDAHAKEQIRALPEGVDLGAKVVKPRNLAFHRKVFSMVQLGFQYWQPTTMVTTVERKTVHTLADFLIRKGLDGDAVAALCSEFLMTLDQKREKTEAEKSFEAFREFVTVEAGFFDTIMSPAGPRRVAKSWSFANMSEEEFQAMYKAIFNVLWEMVLNQAFESPEAAEAAAAAAEQLLNYT